MSTDDHPWHQVSPGDHIPDLVNAIIEIPKGSKAKYEIDKASGLIKLDRVLFSSVMYPDGTSTVLSGKVRRDEIVNEKSFESELHVWKELKRMRRDHE